MDVALTAHPARKRLARFLNSQSIFATHVARHKTACATQNYTRASLPPIGTKFGTKSFPKRRRPKQRWDDHFSEFAMQHLHNDNWIWIEARSSTWNMFGTLLGFFLPKPLQRLVLRLFSHVLMGPYSVWTDSDERGRAKKRNPNLRGKNPRPRSSKSWHNEWSSELAMFWARTINNRKRWSWLTLLEWTIWTHRRRKKRQGLALKILQKSTNIPEKNAYANLEKIIDFIFQISVGMPRNAEIDEILNSLNIFTYWKVRRYLYPKSKARKKMSRMRYVFCSRFISDHETTKKCTCRNVYKKTCASCGHHGFGIAWCVIRRPTYVPPNNPWHKRKTHQWTQNIFSPNVFAQQLVLRDLYILSNIKTPDMSTIFARETNLNINIYFFIVRWWGRNLKKKQCMIATQKNATTTLQVRRQEGCKCRFVMKRSWDPGHGPYPFCPKQKNENNSIGPGSSWHIRQPFVWQHYLGPFVICHLVFAFILSPSLLNLTISASYKVRSGNSPIQTLVRTFWEMC